MGIRCYCPNGHKLNIKAFLAGKKGVCPHCDARFRIPYESEPKRDNPTPSDQMAPAAAGPVAAASAPQPTVGDLGSVPMAAPVQVPAPAAPPAAWSDPISESPDAAWYVRPPSGGQYGPARGDIMRRWVEEGRVTSDSLVWREGWADWRLADGLFSQASGMPDPLIPLDRRDVAPRARRRGHLTGIVTLIVLALLSVASVVALVLVL